MSRFLELSLIALPVLALVGSGCATPLVGAGAVVVAGAGATADLSTRGAKAIVAGTVDETKQQTQAVFRQLNIQPTTDESKDSGATRKVSGKLAATEIIVKLEQAPNSTTEVEVEAVEESEQPDKELAEEILTRIARLSGA